MPLALEKTMNRNNQEDNLKPLVKDLMACLLSCDKRFLAIWKKISLKDKKIIVERLEEIIYDWIT